MATIPGVSNNELIRTTWGNLVAVELNTRAVKVDGSLPMTGTLIIQANPSLKLRRLTTQDPYLQFEHTSGTPAYGHVQGSGAGLYFDALVGTQRFGIANVEVVEIAAGLLKVSGAGRFGSTTGNQVQVVDSNGGGTTLAQAYVGFYPSATSIDVPGTRGGYVGYNGEGFKLQSTVDLSVDAVGGDILFVNGTTERGRWRGATFLVAKAAVNSATTGIELDVGGTIRATTSAAGTPAVYLRHEGGSAADNEAFVQFATAGGGLLADITQRTTVGVNIHNAVVTIPSDYRLKNELGPVPAPLERIKVLAPKRLAWKDSGDEFDGFLAHEVDDVAPNVVHGAKDAVDVDGNPVYQGIDQGPLIALLTAGIQELTSRVEALEAAAA